MRRPTSVSAPALSIAPRRREQLARHAPGRRRRRLQPGERIRVARRPASPAPAPARPDRRARSRARSSGPPLLEVVARVKTQRAPGPGAAGAPGPLGGRRLADLRERQRRQARSTGECAAMRARPESITADDAVDGHRRLGDVRRQDDLAAVAGRTARVCSSSGISPCSGSTSEVAGARQLRQRRLRAADLAGARQKHQQVAVRLLAQHAAHGARHLRGQRPIVGVGQVLERDLEHASLAADHVAAEEVARPDRRPASPTSRARPDRGGRPRAGGAPRRARDRSRRGAREARRARRRRRRAGAGAASIRRTNSPSVMKRHARVRARPPRRSGPSSRSSRPRARPARSRRGSRPAARAAAAAPAPRSRRRAAPRVEQRPRHPRRLARARRRLDDRRAARRDGVGDRRQAVVDRQRLQRHGWVRCPGAGLD